MRILVTGGLGVIGSTITRHLLAAGHSVWIIDSAEEPRNEWVRSHLMREHSADSLTINRTRLEAEPVDLSGVDAVIHCAAHTGIPHSLIDPSDDWRSNVDATRILLDGLRKKPVPTVVLSSIKPYWVPSRNSLGGGLDEHALLDPDEPYAASKAAQSMLCQAYARSYGIPVVAFRCSNLFAAAPCHGPRHGWMTWMTISAAIGRTLEVQGTGNQARDMLHGDDVYSAAMLAIEHADKLKGEIFNLGGGRDNIVSVREVAEYLRGRTGVEVKSAPPRPMDDDLVFVNTLKFNSATGWSPEVKVRDGLSAMLEWAKENREALASLYEGVK